MSGQDKTDSVRLLLNPNLALRQRPWDLSIHLLLERFLEFLKEKPVTDLRLSGLALVTSSLIYKLKVENLFYDEVRTSRKRVSELAEPVDILKMPFRLQPPVSDITDLVSALQSLLVEFERGREEVGERNPFQPGIEDQVMEVDSLLSLVESYSDPILSRLKVAPQMKFTELLREKEWDEVVRLFMAVLVLAHQQKILLQQDEETEEIYLVSIG
jgi:segregation and condensation protein A